MPTMGCRGFFMAFSNCRPGSTLLMADAQAIGDRYLPGVVASGPNSPPA
jgi:hypothetical protein